MSTTVIAELGGVAEGNLQVMRQQIRACADARVNAVKVQWLSSPQRLVDRRGAPQYGASYAFLAYPLAWLRQLRDEAHDLGLGFGCSVYLPEDAQAVAPMVDWLKVAAFEAGAPDLLDPVIVAARRTDLGLMRVSLGMSHPDLVADLLDRRAIAHALEVTVRLWHCISHYDGPIPPDQWNLGCIRQYGLDGFSDHTRHPFSGHHAVLAGARELEVHMRLDYGRADNPDFAVAWSPAGLAEYVLHVRQAEAILGTGLAQTQPCEQGMARFKARG